MIFHMQACLESRVKRNRTGAAGPSQDFAVLHSADACYRVVAAKRDTHIWAVSRSVVSIAGTADLRMWKGYPAMDRFRLDGKVAIVTGGAGGIGRTYAEGLTEVGASVALADVNATGVTAAASEFTGDGLSCTGLAVDIASQESVRATDAGLRCTPVDSAFRKMLQDTVPLRPSAPRPSYSALSSCCRRPQETGLLGNR